MSENGVNDDDDGDAFEQLDADLEDENDLFDVGTSADPFEEMDVPDLDEESVWDAVLTADQDGEENVGDADGDSDIGADGVVPKERYCLTCEYFTDPPDMACTHPGTVIEELVGVDRIRLRNCPVVARRRRAETVLPTDGSGADTDPGSEPNSDRT